MLPGISLSQRQSEPYQKLIGLLGGWAHWKGRVATFVAACDETTLPTGHRMLAGLYAPAADWTDYFTPAWTDRVLEPKFNVKLDWLHCADIHQPKWRQEHELSDDSAGKRLNEAAFIIASSGSLRLISSELDAAYFDELFKTTKVVIPKNKKQFALKQFRADILCGHAFIHRVLQDVRACHPDAQKVDFYFEENDGVTDVLKSCEEHLREWTSNNGFGALFGNLTPIGKNYVPVQAADYACWHIQRVEFSECDGYDIARYQRVARVLGDRHKWTNEELRGFAERSQQNAVPSPFKPKNKPKKTH